MHREQISFMRATNVTLVLLVYIAILRFPLTGVFLNLVLTERVFWASQGPVLSGSSVLSSLVAQTVIKKKKNPPAMKETWVQSLGWEDPLEKERLPTPVFLPGKSYGQRSLAGYSPWGLSGTRLSNHHNQRICTIIFKILVYSLGCTGSSWQCLGPFIFAVSFRALSLAHELLVAAGGI